MYGYFPQELFHLLALTHPARLFSPTVSAGCLPRPIPVAAGAVTRLSPRLRYCSAVRLLTKPRTISLALIGPRSPVPPGDSASPPEVTHCSSVPCHPQTPWCGGWMRTPSPLQCRLDLAPPWADRFIVGVAPLITARYFSSCPSDSTSRWTPCPPDLVRAVAPGRPWLYPAFACVPV
jgi:hypothetical protein